MCLRELAKHTHHWLTHVLVHFFLFFSDCFAPSSHDSSLCAHCSLLAFLRQDSQKNWMCLVQTSGGRNTLLCCPSTRLFRWPGHGRLSYSHPCLSGRQWWRGHERARHAGRWQAGRRDAGFTGRGHANGPDVLSAYHYRKAGL